MFATVRAPVLLLLASVNLAFSQGDSLTINQAVSRALAGNGLIRISALGKQESSARLSEARSTRYPALFFRSHLLYAPDSGYNPVITNGGEYGVQLSAGVPLYDGGVREAVIEQAQIDVAHSDVEFQKNREEISYEARGIYYEIVRAEHEAQIRQDALAKLGDYQDFLAQLHRGGIATESDVLKARVELNNAAIALDAAREAVEKAKNDLRTLLNIGPDSSFEVAELTPADSEDLPRFGERDSVWSANPDLEILARDEATASIDIKKANAERLPTVSLAGDLGFLGVKPSEIGGDFGFSFLLTLDLPLFTWGGIDSRIEQKSLAIQEAQSRIALERRQLEGTWRETARDIHLARRSLAAYGNNITGAENNYLSAKSRFAGGTGSNLEVLEAQQLLTDVKLAYNNSMAQLRTDAALLLKLSGRE